MATLKKRLRHAKYKKKKSLLKALGPVVSELIMGVATRPAFTPSILWVVDVDLPPCKRVMVCRRCLGC